MDKYHNKTIVITQENTQLVQAIIKGVDTPSNISRLRNVGVYVLDNPIFREDDQGVKYLVNHHSKKVD